MSPGIRATVEFPTAGICPITEVSESASARVHSVTSNVCTGDCEGCVTEFTVDTDDEPDGDVTPVFTDGSRRRYRLEHGDGFDCPCEHLGALGCPVTRYDADRGTLTLVFHAAGFDELQSVVGHLRDRFPEMDIKRFIRSPATGHTQDKVVVDREKLTARQFEILRTAFEMGYFERPRTANATEVAAALDINISTFTEHLAAAQHKIFEDVLSEERS